MYYALVTYGAAESLGLIVNLALVRELGPVVTALLFAGRAGTSLTAEIGLMKAGEQLAAMEMMAIDPKSRVLAPRFLAGIVSMPILAILFSAVGILGAYVVAVLLIGVDAGNFWSIMQSKVDVWRDVGNGVVKSFVFGVICTFVALYQGYETAGHARGRGLCHDAHRRDLVARRAGHGLHAHGADVLDAIASQRNQRTWARRASKPWSACSCCSAWSALVFLSLKAANLGSFSSGDTYTLHGTLRQHRWPEGARAGAQRRRHGRPRRRRSRWTHKTYQGVVTLEHRPQACSFRRDTSAKILTAGLLGDQYVGLEPGADEKTAGRRRR